jgi:hypothetical protein
MTYAWSRYAVWTVIALAYFAAGLSKIRNGGLFWWNATNMRGILYMDSLNPMEFDWRVSLYLADTPDAFFAALGLAAVLGELGYIGVLFSQRLRVLLTTAMALMHLGIWFLQNVLFFDLILLQLVFFDLDRPVSRVMRTLNLGRSHIDTTAITPPSRARWLSAPVGLALLVGVMFTSWFLRIEYYPLTGMQMYTPADNSGVVSYYRVIAHPRSGAVERAPIEEAVGAMADGRYRKIARQCFDEKTGDLCRAFMHAAAGAYNRSAAPAEQLVALEAQKWQWNFREHPDDAQHGTLVDRVVIPVGPSPR